MASSDGEKMNPPFPNSPGNPNPVPNATVTNPTTSPISDLTSKETIILDHRDFRKLSMLIREEEEAQKQFSTTSKRRDKFCLELEQKHSLSGLSWEVDHEKGAIIVTGRRQKPIFPPAPTE